MARRVKNPHPKTIESRRLYWKRKRDLIKYLGGICKHCGTTKKLTFDHKFGRLWDVRIVHGHKRLRIYREEAERGLIQLLCLSCNSKKGSPTGEDDNF